jgi:F-type H+-transporting ATPase subunit b
MEADTNIQAVIEVAPNAAHEGSPGVMDVSAPMMLLTWLTFFVLAFVLSRLAWKPILKALDMREKTIRRALEDAEKARAEAVETEARNRQSLQDAATEARRIVEDARLVALDHARQIHDQAEQQAQVLVDEARREIQASVQSARLVLRRECAELAIAVAAKVTERNMDSDRNRELVRTLVGEFDRA